VAAGLTAALDRIAAVVEGVGSWRRAERRITTLTDENLSSSGLDRRYWLRASPRSAEGLMAGSHHDRRYLVTVELARAYGGGDRLSRDYFGLMQLLEAEADAVEQSLVEQPGNWDYATTGILLVNLENSELSNTAAPGVMVWVIDLELLIRQPHMGAAVE